MSDNISTHAQEASFDWNDWIDFDCAGDDAALDRATIGASDLWTLPGPPYRDSQALPRNTSDNFLQGNNAGIASCFNIFTNNLHEPTDSPFKGSCGLDLETDGAWRTLGPAADEQSNILHDVETFGIRDTTSSPATLNRGLSQADTSHRREVEAMAHTIPSASCATIVKACTEISHGGEPAESSTIDVK
ncbi:hypothetical protein LTR37_017231 [Vermiconidia calcicola]|uniref:Uncharacterized protein n=1 Tax=Vermiconidia calcicola TaxID=1690605 RepID=A0ACC3MKM1_9PEZI|nr:hypothetical protein LTR37_017231 [Vermiconidia calcicola]